ncbi:type VI secretion system Vgr family protein [Aquisalimonas asiatica]|uniref:Type VI secretion system secreted protein VgrG n=1 Tax=Aquisalimonas asiatica TaxID=406100 RepID=A0A1H8V5E6_9GAMM|nr:type VI secretion system tip protein VgrG [Aquisalimonas asiatica]SEP09958.1 type VI secretion system secreted protein VgrG [Aquisalimonas asiatica]
MSMQDADSPQIPEALLRQADVTTPDTHRCFRIRLPGIPISRIEVESLESEQHAVNDDYVFTVLVSILGVSPSPDELLGGPATLALSLEPDPAVVHGVVTAVEDVGERASMRQQRIVLQSPLSRAARRVTDRVFRRHTAVDIVRSVLEEDVDGLADIVVDVEDEPPPLPMTVQHGETDLAFVRRVLSRAGLCLVVRQDRESASIVIGDRLEGAGEGEDEGWPLQLRYERQSGQVRASGDTVYALRDRSSEQPTRVEVRDFDPDHPDETRPGEASSALGSDGGRLHVHGQSRGGNDARASYAALVQAGYDSKRREVEIQTGNPRLAPGVRVTIGGHPLERVNDTYVVLEATHQGNQADVIHGDTGGERATYTCVARLIPASIGYTGVPEPQRTEPGLMVGRVEGAYEDRADLNDEGAYRVRLGLDQGDAPEADASPRVRLMQPYGGEQSGMHFPLQARTQVAIAGLNGDVDRPVILGALPHAGQNPPVTTANPYEHVLRTPAGHQLTMDDKPRRERVSLAGAQNAGRLTMSADPEERLVSLKTEQGDLELHAGQDMNVSVGGDRAVEVGGEHTVTVGDDYVLRTEEGGMEWNAGGALDVAAEEGDLLQEATDGSATMRSHGEMLLEAGDGLTVTATEGDTVVMSESGSVAFEVEGDLELSSAGDMRIGSGITIRENGDLAVKGENIDFSAGRITITADEINSN